MEFKKDAEFTKKEIENVEKISEKLKEFRVKMIDMDYIHNKSEFFEIMEEFRKYLVEISVGKNFEIFYHSKHYNFYKDFFTGINEYYLRSLESMQALSVMTKGVHSYGSVSEFIKTDFLKEGFERKNMEFSAVDCTNAKNMVFVGCGPFPETMLYAYENFDVDNILGLDYNHEAIFMAGEMVNGLGFKNVNFKQVDAVDFDYCDADIVFIPLFVSEKHNVMKQVEKTGKSSVQILSIVPRHFLNLIFKGIGKNNNRLRVTKKEYLSTEFSTQEVIRLEKYNF